MPGDGVVPCDGANSHRESVPLESCGPAPECPECVWWPSADGGQGGRGRVFCLFGEIRACASVEPRVSCVPEHRLCGAGQALSDFLSSFLVTSRLAKLCQNFRPGHASLQSLCGPGGGTLLDWGQLWVPSPSWSLIETVNFIDTGRSGRRPALVMAPNRNSRMHLPHCPAMV